MANKDFFDEEFDKMEDGVKEEQRTNGTPDDRFDGWYSRPAPAAEAKSGKKPLYIVLLCLGLILCIVLGWVLCALLGGRGDGMDKREQEKYLETVYRSLVNSGIQITEEQWKEIVESTGNRVDSGEIRAQALLDVVFDTLQNDYYQEISQEKWYKAVEEAGNALFEAAGDRFCSLMSPQSYYDLTHPTADDIVIGPNGVFGFTFQHVGGVGLYVTEVMTNSSAYGCLQSGDFVVKLSNALDHSGRPLTLLVDGVPTDLSEVVPAEWEAESFSDILQNVSQADFSVLRNGEFEKYTIQRGAVGETDGKYDFIEYYFADDCTNVSITRLGNAKISTKEERALNNLPAETGYIRITQFMYTSANGMSYDSRADEEFKEVMQLFKTRNLKRLVLDLKGNPGGVVEFVCNIASMLVTDAKLTDAQKSLVVNNGKLLITSLVPRNGEAENSYWKSSYSSYFEAPSDKCDIVVWTDGGSASASELLTGALRDYKTAVQMGSRTYGKGIAQTWEEIKGYEGNAVAPNGSTVKSNWAVYYTFAKYLSPLGDNIHGTGYVPDSQFDNLDSYEALWQKTLSYWGVSGGMGSDIPA